MRRLVLLSKRDLLFPQKRPWFLEKPHSICFGVNFTSGFIYDLHINTATVREAKHIISM